MIDISFEPTLNLIQLLIILIIIIIILKELPWFYSGIINMLTMRYKKTKRWYWDLIEAGKGYEIETRVVFSVAMKRRTIGSVCWCLSRLVLWDGMGCDSCRFVSFRVVVVASFTSNNGELRGSRSIWIELHVKRDSVMVVHDRVKYRSSIVIQFATICYNGNSMYWHSNFWQKSIVH